MLNGDLEALVNIAWLFIPKQECQQRCNQIISKDLLQTDHLEPAELGLMGGLEEPMAHRTHEELTSLRMLHCDLEAINYLSILLNPKTDWLLRWANQDIG